MIINVAMTIAGSDPAGGAGIQADMRTFEAMGVKGTSVVSALTAQNAKRVAGIAPVDPDFVALQIETLFEAVAIDAVKTGMLLNAGAIGAVAEVLANHRVKSLVVDPVMKATAGGDLLEPSAVKTLIEKIFPIARMVTPNAPEATSLTGIEVTDIKSMKEAAMEIARLGPENVVITGGHIDGERLVDLLLSDGRFFEFVHQRIDTKETHGTGCVFSAAITAALAMGRPVEKAVKQAGEFVEKKLKTQEEYRSRIA
ncbi:Hydroxymethylpyrimidine phosphate kinase ThiD [hydrothermal vent metagenome]|uniref:Hydroxymethylpyrimidine phosphate kinase ThiD n=1 Tax=hydrothermal vent metagenome TaxID=652676 RepID=A0A3B1CLF1_9ZZZZ